jgi:hypothetical protein
MATWYTGHGWGWCSVMVNIPAMVLFWGAVLTAMVLAAAGGCRCWRADRLAAAEKSGLVKPTTTSFTVSGNAPALNAVRAATSIGR